MHPGSLIPPVGGLQITPASVYNEPILVSSATIHPDDASSPGESCLTFRPSYMEESEDYALRVPPIKHECRFQQASGILIPSFSMVFEGTFTTGDALGDLIGGQLEVYVYRIAGLGRTGPPSDNLGPLRVHEPFSFAAYDDGATIIGSGIREGSSVGNTINCTFGTGTPADTGFYCQLRIVNTLTRIYSVLVTFI